MKKKALQNSPPVATPNPEETMQGFLVLRVKTYYFRRKIPVEVRPYFPTGSKEILRSLGTSVKKDAISLCRDWVSKTERLFVSLKMEYDDESKINLVNKLIQPSKTAVLTAAPVPEKGLTIKELIVAYVNHKSAIWSLKSKQEVE
jgi:hypothetical protein